MNVALIRLIASLLAIVVATSNAKADVVLSMTPEENDVVVSPGGKTQLTIGVQLATTSGTQQIRGYTIPIDLFEPFGTDPPAGFEVVALTQRFDFQGLPFRGDPDPQEGDLLAEDGNLSDSFEFTTTPVTLFDFTVEISDSAAPGDYTAAVVSDRLFTINDGSGASIPESQITFQPATISVTAVPEPTGVVALCGIATFAWLRRRGKLTRSSML